MQRRSGVTLLEVLVAIFVMGIGMLALLTLFPLGALRMQDAIQKDRCASVGASARSVAVMKNIPNDGGVVIPSNPYTNPFEPLDPIIVNPVSDANLEGPSYPVLIDATGLRTAFGTTFQTVVGGKNSGSHLARRTVSFVSNNQDAFRWFALLDDIDFENSVGGNNSPTGTPNWVLPVPPNSPAFFRDVRFSCAFLCQRPRHADSSVVDTAVVVYHKRPLAGNGNQTLPEYVYPTGGGNTTTFNPVTNTITIDYVNNLAPPVRAGDWVLDNTPVVLPNGNIVSAHGYFYRIVAVNDLGGTVTELEVETPLRGFTAATNGTAIILDGVMEVFTKGTARLP